MEDPEAGRIVVKDRYFAGRAASWIADQIEKAIGARGRCTLALAGGRTYRPIYGELAKEPLGSKIPWSRVEVYFGDERCVPPDHPESTYRMAREVLFQHVPLEEGRIHRIEAEGPDREGAAAEYAARLPDPLDILLLGMGEDGHTASLFPGSEALDETERRVVAVKGPKPPPWRITITPPVVEGARAVMVAVSGKGKAAMASRAVQGPPVPKEIPVQLALRGFWILDSSAGG
jgi:6-phosphogluconolactonase